MGRGKLASEHETRMADLRLLRQIIERDPDSPAAKDFLDNFQLETKKSEKQERNKQDVMDQLGFGVSPHSPEIRRMFR